MIKWQRTSTSHDIPVTKVSPITWFRNARIPIGQAERFLWHFLWIPPKNNPTKINKKIIKNHQKIIKNHKKNYQKSHNNRQIQLGKSSGSVVATIFPALWFASERSYHAALRPGQLRHLTGWMSTRNRWDFTNNVKAISSEYILDK